MRMKLVLAGLFFFVGTVVALQTQNAQKGAISGLIVRSGGGEPIRKALVTIQPMGRGQGATNTFAIPNAPGQAQTNPQGQRGGAQQQPAGGAKSIVTGEDGVFNFTD